MCIPYNDPSGGKRGVRTHKFTMMIDRRTDGSRKTYLYDNLNDPFQLKNLAEEESGSIEELSKELQKWLVVTKDNWKY